MCLSARFVAQSARKKKRCSDETDCLVGEGCYQPLLAWPEHSNPDVVLLPIWFEKFGADWSGSGCVVWLGHVSEIVEHLPWDVLHHEAPRLRFVGYLYPWVLHADGDGVGVAVGAASAVCVWMWGVVHRVFGSDVMWTFCALQGGLGLLNAAPLFVPHSWAALCTRLLSTGHATALDDHLLLPVLDGAYVLQSWSTLFLGNRARVFVVLYFPLFCLCLFALNVFIPLASLFI
jgi:hypothetical protein